MNNDFKKGFFFSAGFLAFLLIPTGIYFASSINWGEKFDKQKAYINKWVKDLNELTYPTPMVDHAFARNRAIATYKDALASVVA